MKDVYAIMHTPLLGYYWRTQSTYNPFDPPACDWILSMGTDQSTAEELVRIATEQGVEAMKAAARLLQ